MGRFIFLAAILALAASLSGCDEPAVLADLPPEGTPYISVSYGTSEWGGGSTRYFATDVAVTTRWEGVGGGESVTVSDLAPGTYDRAAAWLAREGPRALARHGEISICPGEAGGIGAVPPVGGFDYIVPDCTRDSEAYEELRRGLMAVLSGG